MISVETAVRAWVAPRRGGRPFKKAKLAFRSARFDDRVLVFDTETTTDLTQRLLFGFFRLYEANELVKEGVILGDAISASQRKDIVTYAGRVNLHVYSRHDFVHKVFFRYVYALGALCVGFNLPFDLSRVALGAGAGRGKNANTFRLTMSPYMTYSAVRVRPISGRAAFMEFAPKSKLQKWEKPFFKGRFLDLSTLTNAITGERYTLKRAARDFGTEHRKSATESLGEVTIESLDYGRNDVVVTWELFEKLKDEYSQYPFATMENERKQPDNSLPITRIYSSASIAKATLSQMGFPRPAQDPEEPV